MFICSFKLNKTRVLSAIAALCLSLTLVFLMLPDPTDSTASAGTVTVKDEQAMVEYLESIGRTVSPQALLIEEITIPETFNEEYEEYNQLQVSCGFDLSTCLLPTCLSAVEKCLFISSVHLNSIRLSFYY